MPGSVDGGLVAIETGDRDGRGAGSQRITAMLFKAPHVVYIGRIFLGRLDRGIYTITVRPTALLI